MTLGKVKTATAVSGAVTAANGLNALLRAGVVLTLILASSAAGRAQIASQDDARPPQTSDPNAAAPSSSAAPVDLKSLPKHLVLDQKDFWTAPLHFSEKQWDWALPSILVGGLLIKADGTLEKHVPTSGSTVSHAVTASNAGVALLTAGGAGLFLLGHMQSDDQKRETGILAGEAAIGAFAENEIFKYAAGRERPFTGSGTGRFFVGGDSFPSTHAAVSWAIASVIAHEYPGPLTQVLAYGVAGGVSAARFAGQKHFASDVIIGSALGWYMGYQVFHSRSHYSDAEIARYGTFYKGEEDDESAFTPFRKTRNMGSPLRSARQLGLPCPGATHRFGVHSNRLSRPSTLDASRLCPPNR